MAILKWKTVTGWVELYANELRNRLRRDKNLADLTNKSEARANLELINDVSTHHHDSRYLPLIRQAKDEALNYAEQKTLDRQADIQRLETEISTTNADNAYAVSVLTNSINELKAQFCVGPTPPLSPQNGKTIWFCTKTSEPTIKFYYDNQWQTFGSRYV